MVKNGFEWKLYKIAEEGWDAMYRCCGEANESIDLEQYIFSSGDIGRKFIDMLIRKCKENVKVRVLCDTAGSFDLYLSSLPDELRKAGGEIRFFNIIRPWRLHSFFSWFFRDHRKLLIIDKTIALTGGVGLRDDMKNWRDTTVETRGAVISEMLHSFEDMWERSIEKNFFKRLKRFRKEKPGEHFVTSAPYLKKRFFYHDLVKKIRDAKQFIYLTTPYFIPDYRIYRLLQKAAARKVQVKIILPEILDVPIVETASNAFYEKLLGHGVKIYKYTGNFLHAKTTIIDDSWVAVGSFNLDSLSFFYNYEGNIVSENGKFCGEVKKHFIDDLNNTREIKLAEWKKRSWHMKLRELLILPFHRLL